MESAKLDDVEEVKKEEPLSTVEQAALDFHTFLPVFINKVNNLPKKETAKLIRRIIEFPLNEKPYVFNKPRERELFIIGRKLLNANLIMAEEVFRNKLEAAKQTNTEEVNSGEAIG